jgi:hypothetical protein
VGLVVNCRNVERKLIAPVYSKLSPILLMHSVQCHGSPPYQIQLTIELAENAVCSKAAV